MADQKKAKVEKKKWYQLDATKIRNYLLIAIVVIIAYSINKKFFLMAVFIGLTMIGKMLRGQIANNMIMFDPLLFFAILIMKFWGIAYIFLYLLITVFIADAVVGRITPGSMLNYFLFHICPVVAVLLFGNLSMAIYGNAASILYSVLYAFFRLNVLPDDPIAVYAKAITNVIFVFLYISFLGPIFQLIM